MLSRMWPACRTILLALTMAAPAAPAGANYLNGQVLSQSKQARVHQAKRDAPSLYGAHAYEAGVARMIDPGADRSRLAGANAIGKSGGPPQPAVWALRRPRRLA